MSAHSHARRLNVFLAFLFLSLLGNACADFGLIWHCISQLQTGQPSNVRSSMFLSSFFVGQSLGVIFLAPILSSILDRQPKRMTSILLDTVYALFLAVMLYFNSRHLLTPSFLFPFAVVTAALGILHRSTVCFGALKELSLHLNLTGIAAKFSSVLFLTNLIGASLSGVIYRHFGLHGCLLLAVLTFLPMPFIYLSIFEKTTVDPGVAAGIGATQKYRLRQGFGYLVADPALLWTTLSTAFLNIASNIFPAVVGIAFQRSYPGRTDIAAVVVSFAILAGFLSFGPLEKVAKSFSLNTIIFRAVAFSTTCMFVCVIFPHPFLFALAFLFHCCGSSLTNITSGSLRIARVPAALTGRVNSIYFAIVHLGQICGGLILVPALEIDLRIGAGVIVCAFLIAGLMAYLRLPKCTLGEALSL